MRTVFAPIVGLALLAACQGDASAPSVVTSNQTGAGVATLHGTVYGVTNAPDSAQHALAGITVSLVRIGELPPEPGGGNPGDTLATFRQAPAAILIAADTLVPPDTTTPPPPAACADAPVAAMAVTDASGGFEMTNLVPGIYGVAAEPGSGGPWSAIHYCGAVVREGNNALSLYLGTGH